MANSLLLILLSEFTRNWSPITQGHIEFTKKKFVMKLGQFQFY
jgi:hypothetical protein